MLDSLILSCYENGYSTAIYNGLQYFAVFVQLFALILTRKAYGFSLKRTVVLFLLIYPFILFFIYFVTWVEFGFTNWGANNTIRVYVWLPLLMLGYSKLLKIPFGKLCDFFSPTFPLAFGVGHVGCIFAGCCHGYPFSHGIYNPDLHMRLFPTQPLECLVSLALGLILLRYARKRGYEGKGKVMALFLILAGSTRFLLEFLRDNTKLFLGISELAIWAFLAFAAGCVMMYIICKAPAAKAGKKKA